MQNLTRKQYRNQKGFIATHCDVVCITRNGKNKESYKVPLFQIITHYIGIICFWHLVSGIAIQDKQFSKLIIRYVYHFS